MPKICLTFHGLTLESSHCRINALVKQTLVRVPGVDMVKVSLKEKKATVTFDDSKTNVAALTAATANVGFPSRVIE